MNSRIYFDHSATTPLDPRVLTAMGPFLGGAFGNPSSLHYEGRVAREAVETARAQLSVAVRCGSVAHLLVGSGSLEVLSVHVQPANSATRKGIRFRRICRHRSLPGLHILVCRTSGARLRHL